MIQVLIVDNVVMAFGPFYSDEDNLFNNDMVFPKSLNLNWKIVEADVGESPIVTDWEFEGTSVVKKTETASMEVPESVSPRQIRQALSRADLRQSVETTIAAGDQDTRDWYEYATAFERTNSHVIAMGNLLGVSDSQLDDLWRLAGTL